MIPAFSVPSVCDVLFPHSFRTGLFLDIVYMYSVSICSICPLPASLFSLGLIILSLHARVTCNFLCMILYHTSLSRMVVLVGLMIYFTGSRRIRMLLLWGATNVPLHYAGPPDEARSIAWRAHISANLILLESIPAESSSLSPPTAPSQPPH